jgi:hypothetical protein
MYKPFHPGAPRDIDEAARRISRILDREERARARRLANRPSERAGDAPIQLAQTAPPTGTGLTNDDIFNMLAFDNTSKWEGFRDRVYYDSHGVPTVGYGYALIVDGRDGWTVRDDADLESIGITLAAGDRQRLEQVARALQERRDAAPSDRLAAARDAVEIGDFGTTLTEEGARNTFDLAVPEYKRYVTTAIEQDRFERLLPEQQAALFDLAYRNPSWLLNNQRRLRNALDLDFAAGNWTNTAARLDAILPDEARAQGAIDYFQNPKAAWVYQARPGQVFTRDIAPQIGVTGWDEIAGLNPHITDPNRIQSGQRIYFMPPKPYRGRRP